MPFFVIISGYLFSKSSAIKSQNITKEIWKTIISFGIPYLVFSIILIVFKGIGKHYSIYVYLIEMVKVFVFPITYLWYIYALAIMRIICILIFRKGKPERRRTRKLEFIVLVIAAILFLIEPLITTRWHVFEDTVICDFMKFFVYFMIGFSLFDPIACFLSKDIKATNIVSCGASFLLIALFCIYSLFGKPDIKVIRFLLALSGSFLFCVIAKSLEGSSLFSFLGKNSLEFYLLHPVLISIVRTIVYRGGNMNSYLFLAFCTLIVLGMCYAIVFSKAIFPFIDFCFHPLSIIKKK